MCFVPVDILIFRKNVSSMDGVSLLSFSVLLNTVCPRLCSVALLVLASSRMERPSSNSST